MKIFVSLKDFSYRISGDNYQNIIKGQLFVVQSKKELPGMHRTEFFDKEDEYYQEYYLNSTIGDCSLSVWKIK